MVENPGGDFRSAGARIGACFGHGSPGMEFGVSFQDSANAPLANK